MLYPEVIVVHDDDLADMAAFYEKLRTRELLNFNPVPGTFSKSVRQLLVREDKIEDVEKEQRRHLRRQLERAV